MAKKKKKFDWDRIKKAVKGAAHEGGKAADWYFGADLKKGGKKKRQLRGRQTDIMGERFDVTPDDLFGFGRERREKRPKKKKKKKKDNIKVIVIRG